MSSCISHILLNVPEECGLKQLSIQLSRQLSRQLSIYLLCFFIREYSMLPLSIELIISGQEVESGRIEYKENWNLAECIRTICAFLLDGEHLFLKEECGQSIVRLRFIAEKWTGRYFSV